MQRDRLIYLLEKYRNRDLSQDELNELLNHCNHKNEPEILAEIQETLSLHEGQGNPSGSKELENILKAILKIDKDQKEEPASHFVLRRTSYSRRSIWWAAAAFLLLILSAGVYYYANLMSFNHQVAKTKQAKTQSQSDIRPGTNGAVLTLSNGKIIVLDSSVNGQLAQQGNAAVIKKGDNLDYALNQKRTIVEKQEQALVYNTIQTPRGTQFHFTLSDGSKIWLNAGSSIRFPATFPSGKREVSITGEVYFEVAKDTARPFMVNMRSAAGKLEGTVQVLGTRFNINAYDDETEIRTTLLEGSVKQTNINRSILLKPGQQAQWNKPSKSMHVRQANIEKVMAWKNGLFLFDNTSIYDIMREVSRWYNVDVFFKDSLNVYVNGDITRNADLPKLFSILEQTGELHFKVNGNRIEVSK